MTTRGDVRVDVVTRGRDEGGKDALAGVNAQLDKLGTVRLAATLSVLQQMTGAAKALWSAMAAGEQALNIQRAFESTVQNSARALINAQRASRGLVDDTTLQRQLVVLQRMNVGLADQSRVMDVVAKVAVSSGEEQVQVFRKVVDSLRGSKEAMKDYGIATTGAASALDEMAAATANVDLAGMTTDLAEAKTGWDNFVSGVEVAAAETGHFALKVGEAVNPTAHVKDAIRAAREESAQWAEALETVSAGSADYTQRLLDTKRVLEQLELERVAAMYRELGVQVHFVSAANAAMVESYRSVNESIRESIEISRTLAILQQALSDQRAAATGPVELTSKTGMSFELAGGKVKGQTVFGQGQRFGGGGGGRKKKKAGPDIDSLVSGALEDTGLEGQGAAKLQMLEREFELERGKLEILMASGAEVRMQVIEMTKRHEIAKIEQEFAQGLLDIEERRHRIQVATNEAARDATAEMQRQHKAQESADKKTSGKPSAYEITLGNQLDLISKVANAAVGFAAKNEENERARAALLAGMAILDATMASIRIISDMGVAGIPLAAATMAMGAFAAAGYASQGGRSARTSGPAVGQGFQATAIGSRPESGAGSLVMNFNAPVIGGTAQEISARLGEFGDSGGMREGAA